MAVTTYTWAAGTAGFWATPGNWTVNGKTAPNAPGAPGTSRVGTDVAYFDSFYAGSFGSGSAYDVTVRATDPSFNVGTISLWGESGNYLYPNLIIDGSITTGTLAYTPVAGAPQSTLITVAPGGVFDITSAITNSGSTNETIQIGATGVGGHVELGSTSVNNGNVSFSFTTGTGPLAGELEFLSGYTGTSNVTVSQHITNFDWGDKLVFDGASFNGDTFSYSGTTLTVKSGSTAVLTISNLSGTFTSISGSGDTIYAVCFAADTRILTPSGERTVESLEPGEMVLTLSGGDLQARPIKWVGRRRFELKAHPRPETVAPVRIRRGAFADNRPYSDLLVSPDHAIFVDGRLICARQLINGATIRQEVTWPAIEYFHVELDAHSILLANGLAAESYLNTGNRGFFSNSGEPLMLHPDLTDEADYATREAGSCAPFVWDEANVRPVWERLAARAVALGRPVPRPTATTTDPDLRVVVKGHVIRPIYAEKGLHIFALPKGAREVHLISRASSPTAARPWMEDRRLLGVYVERIAIRSAHEVRAIPLDYPGLTQGWWAVEQNSAEQRRWTDVMRWFHCRH
jgi:hypothetical protein